MLDTEEIEYKYCSCDNNELWHIVHEALFYVEKSNSKNIILVIAIFYGIAASLVQCNWIRINGKNLYGMKGTHQNKSLHRIKKPCHFVQTRQTEKKIL